MTRGRAAWRRCAAAGCPAFLCAWLFGRIPGLIACGPSHGLGPVIAFELARSPAEVAALFGTDPCRTALVGAQKVGLLLDAVGFIPSYTAFLIFAAYSVGSEWRWYRVLVAALLVAGLCDEVEGGLLYAILRDLPGTPALLDGLSWVVRVKFALLALGTLAIGGALIAARRGVAGLFGLVVVAGGAGALYGFLHIPTPVMMGGFALAWVALLLAAFTGAFWPAVFSPGRAAPPRPQAAPTP